MTLFNLDYNYLDNKAKEHGYITNVFEQVIRLLAVQSFVSDHPLLKANLALKGGTAINLVYFDVLRLSVDLDFDFTRILTKEDIFDPRNEIRSVLRTYMVNNGYGFSDKSRQHYSMDSEIFSYVTSSKSKNNIKVDINYLARAHVLPTKVRKMYAFGLCEPISVNTLHPIESFASKMVALLSRCAARDLFDVLNIARHVTFTELQKDMLRKCVVFYSALSAVPGFDPTDLSKIDSFVQSDVRRNLAILLKKGASFNLACARDEVKAFLKDLIVLSKDEKTFLTEFHMGSYRPELIFSGAQLSRIKSSPLALWKTQNANKARQQSPLSSGDKDTLSEAFRISGLTDRERVVIVKDIESGKTTLEATLKVLSEKRGQCL